MLVPAWGGGSSLRRSSSWRCLRRRQLVEREAKKPAAQVVQDAQRAAVAAKSLHMTGRITGADATMTASADGVDLSQLGR